jgi:hypothetical protein
MSLEELEAEKTSLLGSSNKKDLSQMSVQELEAEKESLMSGASNTSSPNKTNFLSGTDFESAPEESALSIMERAKVGMGTNIQSKAAIIKSFGKYDVQVTADNKLLVDGKPYDSSIFSMRELLSDLVDHSGSITEMAPAIAADVAAAPAGLAGVMAANAAGMAVGTAARKGIAQSLGGDEGGPKEYAEEMGLSAGVGALGGAAPFAYGGAVRHVGKMATVLAKGLGGDLPKVAKFFAKIEPAASQHLIDFARNGILPSQVITPVIAKKEFVDESIRKALTGGVKKDFERADYLIKQASRLQNAVSKNKTALVDQGYVQDFFRTAMPELKNLTDDEFKLIAKSGSRELSEIVDSPDYNSVAARGKNQIDPMERATRRWIKGAREARTKLGENSSRALMAEISPDRLDKATIDVGGTIGKLFSGLQKGVIEGPEVLDGTDIARGLATQEKEALKGFLDRFSSGAGDVESIAKQLGFKSSAELKGRAPQIYKEALSSGKITTITPRQLITFEKELTRLMDNMGDKSTRVGAYLSRYAREFDGIMKSSFGKTYERASSKYHGFMSAFRELGLDTNDSVVDAGNVLKKVANEGDWKSLKERNLSMAHSLARSVGVDMTNVLDEISKVRISKAFNSARIGENVRNYSKGAIQVAKGVEQGAPAEFLGGLDNALPASLKFMDNAKKHFVASEFTRKDIDFYHLKSLFYLLGGSQLSTGLHNAGVPAPVATGAGFLLGMKGMKSVARPEMMQAMLAREGLMQGGKTAMLKAEENAMAQSGKAAFRKAWQRYPGYGAMREALPDREK